MKLKRISAGFYEADINGYTYEVARYTTRAGVWWGWNFWGKPAHDAYATKKEAVAALIEATSP